MADNLHVFEGEATSSLIPRDRYRPIMKKAIKALPNFDDAAELAEALFSKDELEWLKDNLRT